MNHRHARQQIAQGDSLQDSQEADVRPAMGKAAGVEDAQEKKQDCAANQPPIRRTDPLLFAHLAEGEHRRHSHKEDEQREDQVVEAEALPADVFQLRLQGMPDRRSEELQDRQGEILAPNDPHHVESPQGVDAQNARTGGRRVRNCRGSAAREFLPKQAVIASRTLTVISASGLSVPDSTPAASCRTA